MENIFKDAKFGDKFLTRDGRIAIYNISYDPYDWTNRKALDVEHRLIIEGEGAELVYLDKNNGMINTPIKDDLDYRKGIDIVAKYTIDEEELDRLAESCCIEDEGELYSTYLDGFKAGYRAAKEH